MFDIFDPSKIFIVGVVALIVIGPKELPRVMRTVGQVVGRMRRMANEFQAQFNEAMREAELEDVKKELAAMNEAAKVEVTGVDVSFDPATLTQHDQPAAIEGAKPAAEEKPVEPAAGEARSEADLDDVKKALEAMNEAAKTEAAKPAVAEAPFEAKPNGATAHSAPQTPPVETAPPLQAEFAESALREGRAP
ncbi:MAG TPA: Sec-independent protein translocase protein TatB [Roseiarcus sp.]|nr:Sec-independent protein translocase protein TatB [Roseiarcus sp.]